jgi:hypothetical protein
VTGHASSPQSLPTGVAANATRMDVTQTLNRGFTSKLQFQLSVAATPHPVFNLSAVESNRLESCDLCALCKWAICR